MFLTDPRFLEALAVAVVSTTLAVGMGLAVFAATLS
jgi:hypothetical protein